MANIIPSANPASQPAAVLNPSNANQIPAAQQEIQAQQNQASYEFYDAESGKWMTTTGTPGVSFYENMAALQKQGIQIRNVVVPVGYEQARDVGVNYATADYYKGEVAKIAGKDVSSLTPQQRTIYEQAKASGMLKEVPIEQKQRSNVEILSTTDKPSEKSIEEMKALGYVWGGYSWGHDTGGSKIGYRELWIPIENAKSVITLPGNAGMIYSTEDLSGKEIKTSQDNILQDASKITYPGTEGRTVTRYDFGYDTSQFNIATGNNPKYFDTSTYSIVGDTFYPEASSSYYMGEVLWGIGETAPITSLMITGLAGSYAIAGGKPFSISTDFVGMGEEMGTGAAMGKPGAIGQTIGTAISVITIAGEAGNLFKVVTKPSSIEYRYGIGETSGVFKDGTALTGTKYVDYVVTGPSELDTLIGKITGKGGGAYRYEPVVTNIEAITGTAESGGKIKSSTIGAFEVGGSGIDNKFMTGKTGAVGEIDTVFEEVLGGSKKTITSSDSKSVIFDQFNNLIGGGTSKNILSEQIVNNLREGVSVKVEGMDIGAKSTVKGRSGMAKLSPEPSITEGYAKGTTIEPIESEIIGIVKNGGKYKKSELSFIPSNELDTSLLIEVGGKNKQIKLDILDETYSKPKTEITNINKEIADMLPKPYDVRIGGIKRTLGYIESEAQRRLFLRNMDLLPKVFEGIPGKTPNRFLMKVDDISKIGKERMAQKIFEDLPKPVDEIPRTPYRAVNPYSEKFRMEMSELASARKIIDELPQPYDAKISKIPERIGKTQSEINELKQKYINLKRQSLLPNAISQNVNVKIPSKFKYSRYQMKQIADTFKIKKIFEELPKAFEGIIPKRVPSKFSYSPEALKALSEQRRGVNLIMKDLPKPLESDIISAAVSSDIKSIREAIKFKVEGTLKDVSKSAEPSLIGGISSKGKNVFQNINKNKISSKNILNNKNDNDIEKALINGVFNKIDNDTEITNRFKEKLTVINDNEIKIDRKEIPIEKIIQKTDIENKEDVIIPNDPFINRIPPPPEVVFFKFDKKSDLNRPTKRKKYENIFDTEKIPREKKFRGIAPSTLAASASEFRYGKATTPSLKDLKGLSGINLAASVPTKEQIHFARKRRRVFDI